MESCNVDNSVTGVRPNLAATLRMTAATGQAARLNIHETRLASRQAQADAENDATLSAEARRLLASSPFVAIRSLHCEVRDGVLTLRGRVATFYLKQVALSVVRPLVQVREVRNEVEVGVAVRRACLWFDDGSPSLPK